MSSDMAADNYTDPWTLVLCGLLLGSSMLVQADGVEEKDISTTVAATGIDLTVSPLTCVALHKNQVCYKVLEFRWSLPDSGRYCLYASDQESALQCWNHNERDRLKADYASATEIVYELRSEGNEEPLASIVVKTSWVYRTGRRSASGWRLF